MNIFNENTCFLNSSLNDEIHFFNISTIDNNLKKIIDEYIIRICYSPKYDININIVKKELLN
jgi:UDP-N-acetylglucosamine pyrophosphorylase